MNFRYNRLLIFLGCFTLFFFQSSSPLHIVTLLVTAIMISLLHLIDVISVQLGLFFIYVALCFILPNMLIFSPFIIYCLPSNLFILYPILLVIPMVYSYDYLTLEVILSVLVLLLISYHLKKIKRQYIKLQQDFSFLQDNSNEISILLEEKNHTLLENQDYEINLATLNERNRISKELHDSIGHLLSRALLMVGALLTVSKEDSLTDGLTILKSTISDGMTSVRNSIHDMHDESIDLYTSLETIIKNFTFCPIQFEYDIKTDVTSRFKYSIIAIVKEALANIMKHSNCNNVQIILREHPAIYQIIISDNGALDGITQIKLSRILHGNITSEGMGLQNIIDRTRSFQGNINFSFENEFRIFITVPKES